MKISKKSSGQEAGIKLMMPVGDDKHPVDVSREEAEIVLRGYQHWRNHEGRGKALSTFPEGVPRLSRAVCEWFYAEVRKDRRVREPVMAWTRDTKEREMIVTYWAWSYAYHVLGDKEHGVWAERLWAIYSHPEGEQRILPEAGRNIDLWRSEVLVRPENFEPVAILGKEVLRRRTISDQPRQGYFWLKIFKPWWKNLNCDMQREYSGEAIRFQRGDQWAGMYETIREVYQPQWEQEIRDKLEDDEKAKRTPSMVVHASGARDSAQSYFALRSIAVERYIRPDRRRYISAPRESRCTSAITHK
jgi:hypothetical protein